MSKEIKYSSNGTGFFTLLAILFIGLKLTGNITWSWLWVLSPIWIPLSVALGIIAIVLFFIALAFILK